MKLRSLFLAPNHRLAGAPAAAGVDRLRYVPSAGPEAGLWWGELLGDQRPVDAFSLTYDSAPLEAPLAMLGRAHVRLNATVDAALANWFVRIEDVAADGEVTAITGGGLSGAQRRSLEHPEPLMPGKEYALELDLHLGSWVWMPGHRIRVAVSNALWPMLWPTPYPMTTALRLGGAGASAITLPVVPGKHPSAPQLSPPEPAEAPPGITAPGGGYAWPGSSRLERDEVRGESTMTWRGTTAMDFPWGSFAHSEQLSYHVADARPEGASVEGEAESTEKLAGQVLTYRGHLRISGDAATLHYSYTRELLRDGALVRTRSWHEDIARDLQ
ncbi:MAG: hypothetical protein JO173_12025 [Gammaproteobacteria bacterium]|nr:hypothetical protein [Gammaproteobacteria bacterium]